ncbi:MAG: DUF4038 domain-containing protein [Chloroflexi bacterium AL-N5]|nr:DUF4038 domain-containing protein [Chloroflexi bacterium AL-N5]
MQKTKAFQWQEYELELVAENKYAQPYAEVELWFEFGHESGLVLHRPAFWNGENIWKVRFAPTLEGIWTYRSFATVDDGGLSGHVGSFEVMADSDTTHRFYRQGFWRMSSGGRNLVHADGTPALLVADTAWALPWRATLEQCESYAKDRQKKGFNAVLLMSVQPDMHATGPRSRTEDYGFEVGFEDLPTGHINDINIAYFQYFDSLIDTLIAHEIVPVYQPLFHGYGWKGLGVAGPVVPPEEYARYCRYLVARYGARPAIYLIGGDGHGYHEQIGVAGDEVEAWDCYQQPAGIHYCPHADNRAYQDAAWLDFQWCQTGHVGEHIPERVADMWRNTPVKGVANGEPTYEHIGWMGNATGWWQGHEAWSNLCAGGTMGVVYGAGSLWQWRLHKDEPGHQDWCLAAEAGWQEALDFDGAQYVGIISKIFDGLAFTDMEPNWTFAISRRSLAVPGRLYIVYLENGGDIAITDEQVPCDYKIIDPRTAQCLTSGRWTKAEPKVTSPRGVPYVIVFSDEYSQRNSNDTH